MEVGVVGHGREVGVLLDHLDRREREAVPGEHVVEAGALAQRERAHQGEPHRGALLVGKRGEPGVERVEVGVGVERGVVAYEPPAPDGLHGHARGTVVQVDHQDVARVDLVEVGDLRRARVADAVVDGVGPGGVAVAERGVVHAAVGQRCEHPVAADAGRLVVVGVEHVELAVPGEHPQRARGRRLERGQLLADEVGERVLGAPRRGDDLDAGRDLVHPRGVEHADVGGAPAHEVRPAEHAGGVGGVVVAGQEQDRRAERPERLAGAGDDVRADEVGLEDVAAHQHERRVLRVGDLPERAHRVEPGLGEARLRLAREPAGLLGRARAEDPARHAELPVGGVHEPHARLPPLLDLRP